MAQDPDEPIRHSVSEQFYKVKQVTKNKHLISEFKKAKAKKKKAHTQKSTLFGMLVDLQTKTE